MRALLLGVAALLGGCTTNLASMALYDPRQWQVEQEQPAKVEWRKGVLDIDTPAGITLWLNQELVSPVEIRFDATAIAAGGPNDEVSDLNVFWMARNPYASDYAAPFVPSRSGKFADYNNLLTYYVGLGGNRNTTTRFRRYIGDPEIRPLLPEHDLSAPDTLLVPNRKQTITLIAEGRHIEYRRDGKTLFTYEDPTPYTRGWFALRSTRSHLRIENLRIRSIDNK